MAVFYTAVNFFAKIRFFAEIKTKKSKYPEYYRLSPANIFNARLLPLLMRIWGKSCADSKKRPKMAPRKYLISIYHILIKVYPNSYQIFIKNYLGSLWYNFNKKSIRIISIVGLERGSGDSGMLYRMTQGGMGNKRIFFALWGKKGDGGKYSAIR